VTVPCSLVFHDLDTFEECSPVTLLEGALFGFSWSIAVGWKLLCVIGKKGAEGMGPSQRLLGKLTLIAWLSGVCWDPTLFSIPFVITQYFGRNNHKTRQTSCFFPYLCPPISELGASGSRLYS
jgi:hypothetical protein